MKGQFRESLQYYKKAFNLDETSVPALAGIIHCQITQGMITEAEQQLEFLAEVKISIQIQCQHNYCNAYQFELLNLLF